MNHYTYSYIRPDGTPYYYGKGSGDRAFSNCGRSVHVPKEKARILIQYWSSEKEAFEMEEFYILLFGRKDNGTGILRNLVNGGKGGAAGCTRSELHRSKISASQKGIPKSEEHRKKLSDANIGHKLSETARRKLREFRIGNKFRLGKPHSEETRRRISETLKRIRSERFWSTSKQKAAS